MGKRGARRRLIKVNKKKSHGNITAFFAISMGKARPGGGRGNYVYPPRFIFKGGPTKTGQYPQLSKKMKAKREDHEVKSAGR